MAAASASQVKASRSIVIIPGPNFRDALYREE